MIAADQNREKAEYPAGPTARPTTTRSA